MGSDIIYPIWPLFVTQVLKANMAALGFLDGLGRGPRLRCPRPCPAICRTGSANARSSSGSAISAAASRGLDYAISSVWPHLIPFRILDRAGKIRSAPRDAIIADISTDANRGHHFGLMRAMDNGGAVVGILICIAFVNLLGYRLLFALAAIPGLAASLLVLMKIKERKAEGVKIYKGLSLKDVDRNFTLYIVLNAVFALGAFTYSFLLIYARKFGFKVAFVPVLYLIYSFTASILSMPVREARRQDRPQARPVPGLRFLGGRLSGDYPRPEPRPHRPRLRRLRRPQGRSRSRPEDAGLRALPPAFRASCLGGFQMIIGLCALPASLIAGLLWEGFGPSAPFYFSLGLTLVAGFLLVFVRERIDGSANCSA